MQVDTPDYPKDNNEEASEQIHLINEDKKRIYKPWVFSVIIKVFRKKINHIYLKRRLSMIWKTTKEIVLIDLGHDYYIVKFFKEENLNKALEHGPWFINGFFLSAKRWHPNFVASTTKETKSVIWIRLPELPMEFYDHSILAHIGQKLGKLVKTDVCTSKTLRGRYARICVEIDIGTLIRKHILIGQHKQFLVYEGQDILCLTCGVLGPTSHMCKIPAQTHRRENYKTHH